MESVRVSAVYEIDVRSKHKHTTQHCVMNRLRTTRLSWRFLSKGPRKWLWIINLFLIIVFPFFSFFYKVLCVSDRFCVLKYYTLALWGAYLLRKLRALCWRRVISAESQFLQKIKQLKRLKNVFFTLAKLTWIKSVSLFFLLFHGYVHPPFPISSSPSHGCYALTPVIFKRSSRLF